MTAYIASLRIDLDRVRSEGYSIDIAPPEPPRYPKGKDMPNVSAAVQEYMGLNNPERGMLSAIAIKHRTTPGSILGRINRGKKL